MNQQARRGTPQRGRHLFNPLFKMHAFIQGGLVKHGESSVKSAGLQSGRREVRDEGIKLRQKDNGRTRIKRYRIKD